MATSARHLSCAAASVLRRDVFSGNSPRLRSSLSLHPSSSSPKVPFHVFSHLPSSIPSSSTTRDLSFAGSAHSGCNWEIDKDRLGDLGYRAAEEEAWTAVLLGWLNAEKKHLRRYAEIYELRGIRAVRFAVSVREVIGIDLGRKVEERIGVLASEIADWCSETKQSGRLPQLIFHTFSNTGWIVYGAIIEKLQFRSDVVEKIKGCVIDSGGDPELNPQVVAPLKKQMDQRN